MARLFDKSRSTINEHILNIYAEGELEEKISKRKIGNSDFSTKPTNCYNLDVIISVGYTIDITVSILDNKINFSFFSISIVIKFILIII